MVTLKEGRILDQWSTLLENCRVPEAKSSTSKRSSNRVSAVRERVVEFERLVRRWAPDFRVYFIEVTFEDVQDPKRREFLNSIGTRLWLPPEEVNAVVRAGRELLWSGRKGDNGRDLERIKALFDSPKP